MQFSMLTYKAGIDPNQEIEPFFAGMHTVMLAAPPLCFCAAVRGPGLHRRKLSSLQLRSRVAAQSAQGNAPGVCSYSESQTLKECRITQCCGSCFRPPGVVERSRDVGVFS